MADCLFCKIARKELDAEVVSETDNALAFRDINPVAPNHVLVIPKEHVASAADLTSAHSDLLGEMFELMARVASEAGNERGFRIVTNVGPDAGQTVHHLHFHVIGGRNMGWPPG